MSEELILDRRACDRMPVAGSITVRPIGGVNHEVALHDLSASGCRVELIDSTRRGDALIARLPQLEPLAGILRWTSGPAGGVEFGKRIHPAVLDALVTRIVPAERH